MSADIFYAKPMNGDQSDRVNIIRNEFAMLFDCLDRHIPTSREKDIYRMKLEEASMWAIKAIAEEVNK